MAVYTIVRAYFKLCDNTIIGPQARFFNTLLVALVHKRALHPVQALLGHIEILQGVAVADAFENVLGGRQVARQVQAQLHLAYPVVPPYSGAK